MSLSLRARLVVGIVVLMACGLAIADVAGVGLLRSYLMQRLDQQVGAPLDRSGPGPSVDFNPCADTADGRSPAGPGQQLPTDFVITLLDRSGVMICQLPAGLEAADTPDLSAYGPEQLTAAAADHQARTVAGRAGAAAWRMRVEATSAGFTVVTVSTAEVQATVRRLALVTIGTSIAILALAVTGGFILVRIGLRPLRAIESTAEAIAGGDLSRRVEQPPVSTEVGRLAAALNAMLTQIEQAFRDRADSEDRLRRFVADASHELRTPVATIRGHAELYRHGVSTSPDEVAVLLGRIESEALRMGALVEDLLLLARLDTAPGLDQIDVDLLSLAADAVVDSRAQDPTRSIQLRPRTDPPWVDIPPVVRGDEARLRQVAANLLGNALRHTPPGLPVEVEVGSLGGNVLLRVIDHGPGLAAEVADRAFERFYRGDPGRTRQAGGVGLGLSIVSSLVQAHHGQVWHEPTAGGGSTFVVSLPARP